MYWINASRGLTWPSADSSLSHSWSACPGFWKTVPSSTLRPKRLHQLQDDLGRFAMFELRIV